MWIQIFGAFQFLIALLIISGDRFGGILLFVSLIVSGTARFCHIDQFFQWESSKQLEVNYFFILVRSILNNDWCFTHSFFINKKESFMPVIRTCFSKIMIVIPMIMLTKIIWKFYVLKEKLWLKCSKRNILGNLVFTKLLNFKSFENLDHYFSFVFIPLNYFSLLTSEFFV